MKRPLKLAILLAAFALSTGCDLLNSTNDHAASDQYCGGIPSEDCPLW